MCLPERRAHPPYRIGNRVDTLACVGIKTPGTFLSRLEYSMLVMTFGRIIYLLLTIRWLVLTFSADQYLEPEN